MSERHQDSANTETPLTASPNATPKPFGRPTDYTPALATKICELLAQGWRTKQIGAREDMPSQPTIYAWLNRYPDFLSQWTLARESSVEVLADESIDIADDSADDLLTDQHGRIMPNMAAVKRADLKVKQRQWFMGKWSKRYADKQMVEHSGTVTLELSNRLDNAIKRIEQQPIDVTPERISVQEPDPKP